MLKKNSIKRMMLNGADPRRLYYANRRVMVAWMIALAASLYWLLVLLASMAITGRISFMLVPCLVAVCVSGWVLVHVSAYFREPLPRWCLARDAQWRECAERFYATYHGRAVGCFDETDRKTLAKIVEYDERCRLHFH